MVKLSKLRNIVLVLIAIAIITELLYLSRLTGFVAVGNEISYSDSINILFNEDREYNWTLSNSNFESIKSIKISGHVKGNGVVKVYIENNNQTYLLFNSKSLKNVNKITGFAIEKNDKEELAFIENNLNETVNQTDTNLTNETLANITQNENVQSIDNTSIIQSLENLTNLTKEPEINVSNITTTTENLTEEAKEENNGAIEFTSVCIDTCNIDFSSNIYKIIVQVNNAELYLSHIEYSIIPLNLYTINQTEFNYTYQNITRLNESLEDIQLQAEINKPVKWVKKIKSNQSGIIKVSVRKEATNIIVKRLEEENEIDVSETTTEINKENETELEISNRLIGPESETKYSIEYETLPPEVVETSLPDSRKIITVSSTLHYTNVLSYTKLPLEVQNKSVRLYWLVNESRIELKDITYLDENNNTLIDSIQWIIPGLSNQTFEVSLIILNPLSYLRNNDTWTVKFNTTGTADLEISSINANWEEIKQDDRDTTDEMRFINLSCGGNLLNDYLRIIDKINNSFDYANISDLDQIKPDKFLVQNYTCNSTGEFSNFMNVAGYAILNFTFGGITEYAYDPNSNTATCAATGDNVPSSGNWNVGSASRCENGTIIMNGNLTVLGNASLTILNVSLLMNNSISNNIFGIQVASGSSLQILDLDNSTATMNDASNISVINLKAAANNRTFFRVHANAKFRIENSLWSGIGSASYAQHFQFAAPFVMSNVSQQKSASIEILAPANHSNITNNYFIGETAFSTPVIIFNTNGSYSNVPIHNITIAYNNVTISSTNLFLDARGTLNSGTKIMHNKILHPSSTSVSAINPNKRATNLWIYNNSIINIGATAGAQALIRISSSSGIFVNLNPNWTFIDNIFNSTSSHWEILFDPVDNNFTINFVNNSINYSKVRFGSPTRGGLEIKWYVDINTTRSTGGVASNVNISLYNNTGNLFTSVLSNSNGLTRLNVTEGVLRGDIVTGTATNASMVVYNNYTLSVNSSGGSGFGNASTVFNISKQNPENNAETPMAVINMTLTTLTGYPPTWSISQAATNHTYLVSFFEGTPYLATTVLTGFLVNFSANWSDNIKIDSYIFEINQTGLFINSTSIYFGPSLISGTASNVTRITAPATTNVTWRFWVNDSEGLWNVTQNQQFIVNEFFAKQIVNNASIGLSEWELPSKANITDGSFTRAHDPLSSSLNSVYLKATNFSFYLPDNAVINGIILKVTRKYGNANYVNDSNVSLIKDDIIVSTNRRNISNWEITDRTVLYGPNGSDLWATTWNYTNINDPKFGAVFAAQGYSIFWDAQANVDYIGIIVNFSEQSSANNPPNWTSGQITTNTTSFLATGYMVNFSSNWSDDTALDSYIFSINQTGLYKNSTSVYFGSSLKTGTASNQTRVQAPYGYNLTWQFWANDSSGNWNSTQVQSFLVTCDYNGTDNWIINATCSLSRKAFTLNGNITILDSGNLSLRNVNLSINNNDYSKNITIMDRGIFELLDLDENNNTINDASILNVTNSTIPKCSGSASACSNFNFDQAGCEAQGCTYDTLEDICFGTPTSCNLVSQSASQCTTIVGCIWTIQWHRNPNLLALYHSTFIAKDSYISDFGQNGTYSIGKGGLDINGSAKLVNNTFSKIRTIAFYNNNFTFENNIFNDSLIDGNYMYLVGVENATLNKNYFYVPTNTTNKDVIHIENSTNITIKDNNIYVTGLTVNGLKSVFSNNLTIYNNFINATSSQKTIVFLYTNFSNISYNNLSATLIIMEFINSSSNSISDTNLTQGNSNSFALLDSHYNSIARLHINSTHGGISFTSSHNNTVSDSSLYADVIAIELKDSNDNYFDNIRTVSTGIGGNSTKIHGLSTSNKIANSILNTSRGSAIFSSVGYNYFINDTFNQTSNSVSGSGIVAVQWYLDTNVTYSNNTFAINANVTTYNRTGIYGFSDLVGSNGLVPRKNVTEYIQTSSEKVHYTNYTIDANTSVQNIQNYSSIFNITNNMQWNITLQTNTIPNFTVIPNITITPVFSPIVAYANSSLNCIATPLDYEQTSLQVNFTWYKNDIANHSFDSLVSVANGSSTGSSKLVTGLKKYDNWTCSSAPYDFYWYGTYVNSSTVQIGNYIPQVELLIPTAGNTNLSNRTPSFQWRVWDADIEDVEYYDLFIACRPSCSADNRSHINLTTTTFNLTIDLAKLGDNNFLYNWTVRAFDDESYGLYAENNQRNFSIQSLIAISLINASVNFSALVPGSNDDTEDNIPNAIGIVNDGNSLVRVNISLLDSGIWISKPSPTPFFSYKISNFTGPPDHSGAFRWETSNTTYTSVPLVNVTAIDLLKYINLTNSKNVARVDINLTVPPDEPGGRKNSTIAFTSILGE